MADPSSTPRRVKNKMKKCDPNEFSIHDFLSECKSADTADERFEESVNFGSSISAKKRSGGRKKTNTFSYVTLSNTRLGPVYAEVSKLLGNNGWNKKKDDSGRFHLILGGSKGAGIPFKRFAQLFKWDYGITPHCNYFRGFEWLSNKMKLLQLLRQTNSITNVVPKSFIFYPCAQEDSEVEEFRQFFESACKRAADNSSAAETPALEKETWILKPSLGSQGKGIVIKNNFEDIVEHVHNPDNGVASWVVQKYVNKPFLLSSKRKFDLSFYVLVDHEINAYLYPRGSVKFASAPFSLNDLCDSFSLLSNEAVQKKHDRFGQDHEKNEMPFETFEKWLSSEGNVSFQSDILPQVKTIVTKIIHATRAKLETIDSADYTAFQLFSFNFMLDNSCKLWLSKVNPSPQVMDKDLTGTFAKDILEIAIKPLFPFMEADNSWKAEFLSLPRNFEEGERDTTTRKNKK